MLKETQINDILSSCGYVRVAPLQFRAVFSNMHVYHYVEMQKSRHGSEGMPGRVRVGNDAIALKTETIWKKYIGQTTLNGTFDMISQIFLNIDRKRQYVFGGRLLLNNEVKIKSFFNDVVTPLLKPIDDLTKLYYVTLNGDPASFSWSTSLPGARAAQALVLANALHVDYSDVVSQLAKRRASIEAHPETRSADELFQFVWKESDSPALAKIE